MRKCIFKIIIINIMILLIPSTSNSRISSNENKNISSDKEDIQELFYARTEEDDKNLLKMKEKLGDNFVSKDKAIEAALLRGHYEDENYRFHSITVSYNFKTGEPTLYNILLYNKEENFPTMKEILEQVKIKRQNRLDLEEEIYKLKGSLKNENIINELNNKINEVKEEQYLYDDFAIVGVNITKDKPLVSIFKKGIGGFWANYFDNKDAAIHELGTEDIQIIRYYGWILVEFEGNNKKAIINTYTNKIIDLI